MSDRLAAALAELVEALREEVRAEAEAGPRAPDRLYDVGEAASALGIQRSKLYGLIAAGELRSVKVGRRRLVPAGAVAEFIRQGGRRVTSQHPSPRRYLAARLRVRSATDPTVRHYIVIHSNGVVTCSCPAGQHHRECRHVKAVLS